MNETFKVTFKRSGLIGCAMKIHYIIDQNPAISGSISLCEKKTLELPRQAHCVRFFLKKFFWSAQTVKEIIDEPGKDCREITIDLSIKLYPIGFLPIISLYYPASEIITNSTVEYNTENITTDNFTIKGTKPKTWRNLLVFLINFFRWIFVLIILLCYAGILQTCITEPETREVLAGTRSAELYKAELLGYYVMPPIILLFFLFVYQFLTMLRNRLKQQKTPDVSLKQPFILYLRCFNDDRKTSSLVDFLYAPGRTEEEVTTEVMSAIAPVVAIGNPGDKNPPKGATRLYVTEDRWKDQVISMLDTAKLVVLRLGETKNFWWEVLTSLKQCQKEKLVFIIPHLKNFNAVLKLVEVFKSFDIAIPETLELSVNKTSKGSIASLIYFVDGKLVCKSIKVSRWTSFFISYQNILKQSFQPLLTSFGFTSQKFNFIKTRNLISAFIMLTAIFCSAYMFIGMEGQLKRSYIETEEKIVQEFYDNCTKHRKKFEEMVKGQEEIKKYTIMFQLFAEGLNKISDEDFFHYYIITSKIKARGLKKISFFHILTRCKFILNKELYDLFIDLHTLSVIKAVENVSDRAMINESEVSKELEIFEKNFKEDSSFTGAEQYNNLVTALNKVEEAGLNKYKLLRYIYQVLQQK